MDTSDSDTDSGFSSLGLRPELLSALAAMGYEEPTPIQRETIPLLLGGRDLIGQAATGTGKTAAFALPILQRIPERGAPIVPVALVLVPTRELAEQVSEALYRYGRDLGARVVPIYGGQPIFRQLQALSAGVHVVVATPGRALDHIARNTLPLDDVQMVVLDEADEMLDMGFAEDIEAILKATPKSRQTVLFSATLPPRINAIAKRHLNDPVKIQIGLGDTKPGKALVRQSVYVVQRNHKAAALGRILDVEAPTAAIVFCRTRTEVDLLTETLNGRGYRAEALHGGLSQESRDRVMNRLRAGTTELLVATDVAARGLDIDQLTHVVNYDVPSAPESYVHRIGRVGRAGRLGVAITLAEPREQRLLANIERLTKQKIAVEKVPSVADLRARQIELTLGTLRQALEADDLQNYDDVIDALAQQFDMRQIALAAVKLTHEASGAVVDDKEIPDASHRVERSRDNDRGKPERPGAPRKGADRAPDAGGDRQRENGETTRIYVGVGRKDGIRPGDLVGAIANETNLSGREIGPIKLAEHFAVVGVPEWATDAVIEALKNTTLKGKKATIRRYTD
ncbi:MAG: ATP-independent helicase [Ilumatobacteraceae bacterium]|nr:ATP-independent helicase [Ilumatobacteraceae bacterium]